MVWKKICNPNECGMNLITDNFGEENSASCQRRYKVLIAEEDNVMSELFGKYLSLIGGFSDVQFAYNGKTALKMISKNKFDLVILNITLPVLDGVAVVEQAHRNGFSIPFLIIVTGYPKYAVRAFDLNAIDFLLIPVSFERFAVALNRFKRVFTIENRISTISRNSVLNIKTKSESYYIRYEKIIYISSRGKKCVIHCVDNDIVVHKLIGELGKFLPQNLFIRNHRQYIVSLKYVQTLRIVDRSYFVKLHDMDDTILPVGRKYVGLVKFIFTKDKSCNCVTSYNADNAENPGENKMNRNKKHILLVEDDSILSMMTIAILKNAGYSVDAVSNGEDALDIIYNKHTFIDIVLMDIDLGHGIDGFETAREINKSADIPIVFLSSHTEKEYIETTEIISKYGYIVKGTGDISFLNTIKMALKLYDANKKIKEKSAILRSLFDASPVGSGFLVNRIFIMVNESLCEMTGYSRDELIGHSANIIYPDENEYERVGRELYGKVENSRTVALISTLKHKNGDTLDVSLRLSPIENNDLAKGVTVTALFSFSIEKNLVSTNGELL